MAGPVMAILFSRAAVPSWREDVERYLDAISSSRYGKNFWVSRMTLPDWSYDGVERPFIVDLDGLEPLQLPWECDEYGETEWTAASFRKVFGMLPDYSINFSAMGKNKEDHRLLGTMAAEVAERLHGVIDMGGLIVPRALYSKVPGGMYASWDALRADVQAFNASLPGKAAAAARERPDGHQSASHIVDATFLRAWMRHADFHMIK